MKIIRNAFVGAFTILGCCFVPLLAQAQSLSLPNVSLVKALSIYSSITDRTVLYGALPPATINVVATVSNKTEAATKIEEAFAREKVAVLKDGEKFLVVVQESQKSNALKMLALVSEIERSNSFAATNSNYVIKAGTFDFIAVPLTIATQVYVQIRGASGVESNPRFSAPPIRFSLRNQTPLTQAEAIHAFDVAFALNGIKMVAAADGKLKLEAFMLPKN